MKLFVKHGVFAFGVAVILGGLTILTIGSAGRRQSALTGDETIEVKQNKIPSDVASWVRAESNVLGAQPGSSHIPDKMVVPILMYHYVEYVRDKGDTIRQSLDTTPYTLEAEIKTLKGAGYTFLTANDLAQVFNGSKRLPTKPILLTFDDGYGDFYTDAYPILQKYNVKATQYVVSGFIGNRNSMTAGEIQKIAADGLVEIGAHTVDHAWLKGLPLKTLVYEINESKKALEELIHKPVVSFAYPYGAFDLAAVTAVSQAGFTNAVSTVPGIDQMPSHRFFLYRLRPGGRTGASLLSWLGAVKDEQVSYLTNSERY